MTTHSPAKFLDYLQVLGLQASATPDEIHKAYRELAAKYHPTNRETRNQEKYKSVTEAYEVLSDPEARKAYLASLPKAASSAEHKFSGLPFFEALSEGRMRRFALLTVLYDRRRLRPSAPSLSVRDIERIMAIEGEELAFCLWYLKQRNLVIADDKSSVQITADGIDYLEAESPPAESVLPFIKPEAIQAP